MPASQDDRGRVRGDDVCRPWRRRLLSRLSRRSSRRCGPFGAPDVTAPPIGGSLRIFLTPILIPAIPMLFGCASSHCWPLPRYGVLLLMPSSLQSPSALYSPSAGHHTARKFVWVPHCRAQPHPFVVKSHIHLVRGRDASMQRTTAHSTCIAIGVTPASIGDGPRRVVGCGLRGDEVGESVAAKLLVEARLSMRVARLESAAERALQPREMVGGERSCSSRSVGKTKGPAWVQLQPSPWCATNVKKGRTNMKQLHVRARTHFFPILIPWGYSPRFSLYAGPNPLALCFSSRRHPPRTRHPVPHTLAHRFLSTDFPLPAPEENERIGASVSTQSLPSPDQVRHSCGSHRRDARRRRR